MATAVIEVFLGPTGLSLTLDLFLLGSDTASDSNITLTEASNRKGLYTGTTAAAITGLCQAFIKPHIAIGYVQMTDDTSIHRVVDYADVFDKTGTSANSNVNSLLSSAQILAAFTNFFNVATPTGTVNSLPAASAGTSGGIVVNIAISDVISDASPTALSFKGSSSLSIIDNAYANMFLVPTSGALKGIPRIVSSYVGATKAFTLVSSFPATPANGDTFDLIGLT